MEVKQLERALELTKGLPDATALFILKNAVELFLRGQEKVYPVTSPKHDHSKQLQDLIDKNKTSGCPYCGQHGAHYCIGRKPYGVGTGIEYWYNQPTSICNRDTLFNPALREAVNQIHLIGSGDNLQSCGYGVSYGQGKGTGSAGAGTSGSKS